VALVNKAPHPNAAKVADNWFLSREGKWRYKKPASTPGQNSLREDIPKEHLPASFATAGRALNIPSLGSRGVGPGSVR